jgi:tripartite-type tricarboxylate transporter receptor subunit TctC
LGNFIKRRKASALIGAVATALARLKPDCQARDFRRGQHMRFSRRHFLAAATGAAPLIAGRGARAQTYPDRPIRLIVPFPPGGAYDTLGRPWADRIKPHLGTVVIENIGGGGASLGAAAAARSRPDGYTLLLGGTLPHVNETLLKAKPLYDPAKDLDPIMRVAVGHLAIAVHPSVPVNTLSELVAYIKANPGKVSYGHSGVGGTNHLVGELFKSIVGTPDLMQIPYRGAGPAMTDLVSGQIPMGIVAVTGQSLGFHRNGAMRILAVTSTKPMAAAPDLPTVVSAGFPAIANEGSYGLLAPAGTPKPIIEKVAQATRTLLSTKEYQQLMVDIGFEATPESDPEDFRRVLAAAVAFWSPLVKSLGLKLD